MDKKRQDEVRKTKEALNDIASRNTQIMKDYGSLGKTIGYIVVLVFVLVIIVGIVYLCS